MLKLMEFGLLAVTLMIVLGLILAGRPEAPPASEEAIGARKPSDETHHSKAN